MNLKTLAFALLAAAMRAALGAFPRGSCPAQPCDWSPYNFMWTNVTPGSFCFNVVPAAAGCEGPCCATFENLLMKFVVNTVPDCKTAFKQVNINGVRKGGGVFFDVYGINNSESELRVTSMSYNNMTVGNLTFCIIVSAPCDSLDTKADADA